MQKRVKIVKNKDGTITVKVDRAVEHFDSWGKTHSELVEYVYYLLLSKGVRMERSKIPSIMEDE